MAGIIREALSRVDDARSSLRDLFTRTADILPDEHSETLTIRIHAPANPRHDRAIAFLLKLLALSSLAPPPRRPIRAPSSSEPTALLGASQTRNRDHNIFPEIRGLNLSPPGHKGPGIVQKMGARRGAAVDSSLSPPGHKGPGIVQRMGP